MRFWLGTHEPSWLRRLDGVPLFVSHRRLQRLVNLYPATTDWALDSGGFTELDMHGEWRTTARQYVQAVKRYTDEIGRLAWAAPQDWMCEPFMLTKTGLTIETHQTNTTRNLIELRTLWPDGPFIPVLQGWDRDDYLRHADQYHAAGVNLEAEPVVGLGSVCRRQATGQVEAIVHSLQGLRLHGFGMKGEAITRYGALLHSCDSMAWSYAGRRRPDPLCAKRSCANCMHAALQWRRSVLNPSKPTLWTPDLEQAGSGVLA